VRFENTSGEEDSESDVLAGEPATIAIQYTNLHPGINDELSWGLEPVIPYQGYLVVHRLQNSVFDAVAEHA
jgi:hypothetical protein